MLDVGRLDVGPEPVCDQDGGRFGVNSGRGVSLSGVSERDDRGEQAGCLRPTGEHATELDGVELHTLGL